jgi:hypothetical protein
VVDLDRVERGQTFVGRAQHLHDQMRSSLGGGCGRGGGGDTARSGGEVFESILEVVAACDLEGPGGDVDVPVDDDGIVVVVGRLPALAPAREPVEGDEEDEEGRGQGDDEAQREVAQDGLRGGGGSGGRGRRDDDGLRAGASGRTAGAVPSPHTSPST